jgi:predicted AAA+ superfamily ATPase
MNDHYKYEKCKIFLIIHIYNEVHHLKHTGRELGMSLLKCDILDELVAWKKRADRKPLILTGVRQCGKTYTLAEFGREHYEDVAYFNFEGNQALAERFSQDLDPKRILLELGILRGKPI